jgi:hypothetical protein
MVVTSSATHTPAMSESSGTITSAQAKALVSPRKSRR